MMKILLDKTIEVTEMASLSKSLEYIEHNRFDKYRVSVIEFCNPNPSYVRIRATTITIIIIIVL